MNPNNPRLKRLVYLTGDRISGYTVLTGGFDGLLPFSVPTTRIGNAFVRVLREEAAKRPDLFPPTAQRALTTARITPDEAYRLFEETSDERLRTVM